MSRFEDSLIAAIRSRPSGVDNWCARLEWAAYRIRIGDFKSAKDIMISARERGIVYINAKLYSRLNFVEGLYAFFSAGTQSAIDKLLRARAIALGCRGDDYIHPLINTWLASIYRNIGDWTGIDRSLNSLLESQNSISDEVRFRLCLVLADILEEVELYDEAAIWYSLAHDFALILGDDAAISAMLFNRASISIFNLRLQYARGQALSLDDGRVALEVASAVNYTHYINDRTMKWSLDLMRAQLHMLKNEAHAALMLLEADGLSDTLQQWPDVDVLRQADIFRCRALALAECRADLMLGMQNVLERVKTIESPGDKALALHSLIIGLRFINQDPEESLMKMLSDEMRLANDDRARESEMISNFLSRHRAKINFIVRRP